MCAAIPAGMRRAAARRLLWLVSKHDEGFFAMTHDSSTTSTPWRSGGGNRQRSGFHVAAAAMFLAIGSGLAPSIARAQSATAAVPAQNSPTDINQLRQEIETLKREYDA